MDGHLSEQERRALLGLWSIPGLGPQCLKALQDFTGGPLAPLLSAPVASYAQALPPHVRVQMDGVQTVEPLAEVMLRRCERHGIRLAWPDEPAYPAELATCADIPPVLFYRGEVGPGQQRLALVGSRHPETGFTIKARAFAREVAQAGVLVVSGAAEGVDRACHLGALDANQRTWAFVGSALDELDAGPKQLLPLVLDKGGAFFTELPPGVRASKESFPRRNRLISGASHATVVLRAAQKSGALYTSAAALRQGRPVLALPGDLDNPCAAGCNEIIRNGWATLCMSPKQACEAVGVEVGERRHRSSAGPVDLQALSPSALQAYRRMASGKPLGFEALLSELGLPSSTLTGALCELELSGLVVQLPGKRYERVD